MSRRRPSGITEARHCWRSHRNRETRSGRRGQQDRRVRACL